MFHSLDRNNDGVRTLNTYKHTRIVKSCYLLSSDRKYVTYHKQTHILFSRIGRIDVSEIQHLLHQLGVEVTMEQASRILQRYCVCVCVCV